MSAVDRECSQTGFDNVIWPRPDSFGFPVATLAL